MSEETNQGPATPSRVPCNDLLGPLPARWYIVSRDGLATLCADEADARREARLCDNAYPRRAPHRAALLGDVQAALALWPRDCRLCAHFRDGLTHAAHCVSVLRCVDSSSYQATQPLQMWERAPTGKA